VPLYHVFGSEELSVLSPGIAELAPSPYVGLNPQDADRLHVQGDQTVTLSLGAIELRLPVRLAPSLPPGVIGVMAGVPGLPGPALPVWGKLQSEGHL
jgi:NADH-quinone oxidoreductase subunit G